MNKEIIIFDVDGTLVESSKDILDDHSDILNHLKEKYEIAICGGGKLEKILKQMNNKIIFDHYFTECGCVYNLNKSKLELNLENVYKKNIRTHYLYEKINILIKLALQYLSNVDYLLTGHFVDLRCGIIYLSCIGMQATDEERKYFIKHNNNEKIRKELLNLLIKKSKELDIHDKVSLTYGGSVGIAIYPYEYDKIQILDTLKSNYKKIIYFGDKYEFNGNDYKIINSDIVIGHEINNVNETYKILKEQYL